MKRHRSQEFVVEVIDDGEPLPDLDDVPKKSIRVQVEELISAGQRLQDARLSALNSVDMGADEIVDELNQYSSADEVFAAAEKAAEIKSRLNESSGKTEQVKSVESLPPVEKVDKDNG